MTQFELNGFEMRRRCGRVAENMSLQLDKQANGVTTSFTMTLRNDVRWLGMPAK